MRKILREVIKIVSALGFLAVFGWVLFSHAACQVTKYKIGDVTCFRQSGQQATVRWVYREFKGIPRPTTYVVLSVNALNQMYEVTVPEPELVECK